MDIRVDFWDFCWDLRAICVLVSVGLSNLQHEPWPIILPTLEASSVQRVKRCRRKILFSTVHLPEKRCSDRVVMITQEPRGCVSVHICAQCQTRPPTQTFSIVASPYKVIRVPGSWRMWSGCYRKGYVLKREHSLWRKENNHREEMKGRWLADFLSPISRSLFVKLGASNWRFAVPLSPVDSRTFCVFKETEPGSCAVVLSG